MQQQSDCWGQRVHSFTDHHAVAAIQSGSWFTSMHFTCKQKIWELILQMSVARWNDAGILTGKRPDWFAFPTFLSCIITTWSIDLKFGLTHPSADLQTFFALSQTCAIKSSISSSNASGLSKAAKWPSFTISSKKSWRQTRMRTEVCCLKNTRFPLVAIHSLGTGLLSFGNQEKPKGLSMYTSVCDAAACGSKNLPLNQLWDVRKQADALHDKDKLNEGRSL